MAMLDEEHEPLPQKPADHNAYKLGSINNHNIVVAGLPQTGNCSAATVVTQMRMTFPNLRYGLLVGIGGGVPAQTDSGMIRLGHVVVSKQTGIHSGAVQYDHGKAKEGHFERTGAIAPPPQILLNAAQALAVQREILNDDPVWVDAQRTQKYRRTIRRFKFPGIENDHLYHPNYIHHQPGQSCDECACDPEQRIERQINEGDESFVVVHRGTIASGELVVKSAALRDRLAQQHGLLCFEMEAAGALADFPCLVIRGISDYCDSHKNDQWHGYAAAAAAAYARQLFFHLPKEETQTRNCNTQSNSAAFQLPINLSEIFEVTRFVAREEELSRIQDILKGTIGRRTAILHGLGGIGKTQLAIAHFKRHRTDYSTAIWLNARDETTLKQSFARIAERIMRHDPSMTYVSGAVESRDADRIVEAVKRWLDEPANDHWLLIYDNYDRPMLTSTNAIKSGQPDLSEEDHTDEAAKNHRDHADPKAFDLRQYLPETDHGAIIVTSRLSVKLGQSIQLGKLEDISDSLEILASASRRDSIKRDSAAHDLALRLDGLPLALATAGAYLEQVAMTCAEYLQLCLETTRGVALEYKAVVALGSLGLLYADQGRLQDAEAMYQRALDGYEKAWGPDHTSTLDTVNNLGALYKDQGRLQDAKAMYQRALDGYEKALGPTLIATYIPALNTLENFAILCVELGRVDEALLYYRRARNGVEAVWGRDSQRYARLSSRMNSVPSHHSHD
ncbi:hypothetical protein G7Z17_g13438 [Cylindrodendrum hubeiense]|uniref:Nucleoside phosphorylase domain-containing protein n=1 Tax=Cylindrodendrum hubeiense TaxID=595255 RepID=A0A9P5GZY7_9HYPO|nr:hypothetical protein G7Z17_g13438 [Cylindrodendrum hubeiense]